MPAGLRPAWQSVGLDATTILNYAATRWLSLGQCLPRLLQNWAALLLFFERNVKPKEASKRPLQAANGPENVPEKKV